MKTHTTPTRIATVATLAFAVVAALAGPVTAQEEAPAAPAPCIDGADAVSALFVLDHPVDAGFGPVIRKEAAAAFLADLLGTGAEVEVAVVSATTDSAFDAQWTTVDANSFAGTLALFDPAQVSPPMALASTVAAAQTALVDRVDDGGCGIVAAMPLGPMAFTADDAAQLCASGGPIDSVRALPAHLALVAHPTAVAGVDAALLDAVAGAPGSAQSCGSVAGEGRVVVGSTREEILAPLGLLVDELVGASTTTDETDVCRVFVCPEGSTTVTAPATARQVGMQGVFPAAGFDVVLEAPNGERLTLANGTGTTATLGGADVTAVWPGRASVSITVTGAGLEGDWIASAVDSTGSDATPARWQRSIVASIHPTIVSIAPTAAGAEATVVVDLMSAAGERVDPASVPDAIPEGVIVDTESGTSIPIDFAEVVDGSHVGTVTLPADLGVEADVIVSLPGQEPVGRSFAVTTESPDVGPGGDAGDDGRSLVEVIAWIALIAAAAFATVWLIRQRRSADATAPVREGAFEVIVGPDGHISRVVDGKTHPLYFHGPDFSDVAPSGSPRVLQGLTITARKSWNPLEKKIGQARSKTGPAVGSEGRTDAGKTLEAIVPWSLARSWVFALDVDATVRANEHVEPAEGVVRGQLHVFIENSLSDSNDWLSSLVADLPEAARTVLGWAQAAGLTSASLGEPPQAGTYAEFANLVTD